MKAIINLIDLNGGGIGFSVSIEKQAEDSGITDAGYLVHQLTETLQRIAVDMQQPRPCIDAKLAQAFIRRPNLHLKEAQ